MAAEGDLLQGSVLLQGRLGVGLHVMLAPPAGDEIVVPVEGSLARLADTERLQLSQYFSA